MKKISFLIGIIALIIAGLGVYSCQKGEISNKQDTQAKLILIENEILENYKSFKMPILTEDIIFEEAGIHKNWLKENISTLKNIKKEIVETKNFTPQDEIRKDLTLEDDIILVTRSIDKIRSIVPIDKQYIVFKKYDKFIDENLKHLKGYEKLKRSLIFVNWMNYEYYLKSYNLLVLKTNIYSLGEDWSPCAHRDCFDCCMYRRLGSDKNFVEYIQFFLNPPAYVGWEAAKCMNDCWF